MGKENKKIEDKPKRNDLKSFLKKRAPFYLAAIALIIISLQGILTEKNLGNSLPELSDEEQKVTDILMNFNNEDESKMTVMEVIKNQINDEYPDEKIFEHKKTTVELMVTNVNSDEYNVILNFKSYKGEINFDWNVNVSSEKITSNNPESKHVIEVVSYS
jgi:uncharacterized membrane protein YhiD involved in acid resistance